MATFVTSFKSSSSETVYEINRADAGHLYCSCPAWKFQRVAPSARTCKHLKALAASSMRGGDDLTPREGARVLGASGKADALRRENHGLAKAVKSGDTAAAQAVLASAKTTANMKLEAALLLGA